jgi:hypothetical protein
MLDRCVEVEEGGLLCFDAMRGVWQYEGGALAQHLQDAAAVCRPPCIQWSPMHTEIALNECARNLGKACCSV